MKNFKLFILLITFLSHATQAQTDTKTKYPLVLIHGLFGYTSSLTIFFSYWSEIPKVLKKHGATVYLASISQAHTVEIRGEQLHDQLVRWGHTKYNLIGHSYGGLDARYILENYPELVASITTIATPNRGSLLADIVYSWTKRDWFIGNATSIAGNLIGYAIGMLSGHLHEQNFMQALFNITTTKISQFNKKYSIGMGTSSCDEGEYEYLGRKLYSWGSYGVKPISNFDVVAKILQKISQVFPVDELNDGLVTICSMKFGQWLGAEPEAHHMVPIGGVITSVLPQHEKISRTMYITHAERLRKEGL